MKCEFLTLMILSSRHCRTRVWFYHPSESNLTLCCPAGPGPTSRVLDSNTLPELPSVPDTLPTSTIGGHTTTSDDIDFDDLTRRFEELKKKT